MKPILVPVDFSKIRLFLGHAFLVRADSINAIAKFKLSCFFCNVDLIHD